MNIPEEAICSAANAIHRHDVGVGLSSTYSPNEHHRNEALAALESAAKTLIAQAVKQVRANNDNIAPGDGAYSSGFHYALDCLHLEETD